MEEKKHSQNEEDDDDEGYIGNRADVADIEIPPQEEFKTFIGHMLLAPTFLLDNEYILHGYRINFNTKKKICRSLFQLHNETVNVWSHITGVIAFIILLIYSGASLYASNTYNEIS